MNQYGKRQACRGGLFLSFTATVAAITLLSTIEGVASLAHAGEKGLFIGLQLHSSHIGAEEPKPDSPEGSVFIEEDGGGAVFSLGYRFSDSFPVRIVVSGAAHETTNPEFDFVFSSVMIEAAYLFDSGLGLRPYLFGGIGGYSMKARQNGLSIESTGPGADFGGGLFYFLSEHFALDLALRFDVINWEKNVAELRGDSGDVVIVETPVDEEGAAAKILLGGSWWF